MLPLSRRQSLLLPAITLLLSDGIAQAMDLNPAAVTFELPAFVNNIASTSAGTVDNGAGAVTIPARTQSVTVTLAHAPAAS